MASPVSIDEFVDLVHKSGVTDEKRLDAYLGKLRDASSLPSEPSKLAGLMVRDGILTQFQAEYLMQGKWRRFTIGKYKVLERLGSGGMGTVFLCEHKLMRCMRAIKILPAAKAQDEAALSRFYREARAVAAIDHPNIVHAYDIDQDESLHFLVMEYVDGASLQEIVKKSGPVSILRACHYIRQAAIGLDHAHRAGLVHRDIKPGNILVSRDGAVKVLDLGLARFFNDDEDILTRKFDENVLGTADYLAPEQAIDSHTVDIRADIYSLGATFYFLLTGKTPFGEGTIAQKLLWHQSRQPRPVRELRPDIPPALEAVLAKMMAKDPANRYDGPADVTAALEPFTETSIGAPPEAEMPRLSPAACAKAGSTDSSDITSISKPTIPLSKPATPPRALQGMGGSSSAKQAKTVTAPPPTPRPTPPASTSTSTRTNSPVRAGAPVSAPAGTPEKRKTAATTVPPPAPSPVPTDQGEPEEEFGWQALAGDTADPAGRADTTPQDTRTAARPRTRPMEKGEQNAVARERGVVLLVIALMVLAGFLVVVVGGGIWMYVYLTAPAETAAKARPPLVVSRDANRTGAYRSVQAALRVSRKDDVIEIADSDLQENIVWEFNPRHSTEVTIQAAPGKEVVWRSARKDASEPIIKLSGASFFKLKGEGIILDGDLGEKGKVKDLILVMSSADGIAITDLKFRNFGRSAVAINSAAGSLEEPLRLKGLTALSPPADKEGSVVSIDARQDMKYSQVDYIDISDIAGPPGLPPAQLVHAENGTLGDKLVRLPDRNK